MIAKKCKDLGEDAMVATTSKDAVKLQTLFKNSEVPLFEFPITIQFLFGQEEEIKQLITDHVRKIQRSR